MDPNNEIPAWQALINAISLSVTREGVKIPKKDGPVLMFVATEMPDGSRSIRCERKDYKSKPQQGKIWTQTNTKEPGQSQ